MRKRSIYDDLLLKSFIRESFIQCKKEDLFERKSKNILLQKKEKPIEQIVLEFNESINKILESSKSKYSIKKVLLEYKYKPIPELEFDTNHYKNNDPFSFDFSQETKKLEKEWEDYIEACSDIEDSGRDEVFGKDFGVDVGKKIFIDPETKEEVEYYVDTVEQPTNPYSIVINNKIIDAEPEYAKQMFIHTHREAGNRTFLQWCRDNQSLIMATLLIPMAASKFQVKMNMGSLMVAGPDGSKIDLGQKIDAFMTTAPGGKISVDTEKLEKIGISPDEAKQVQQKVEAAAEEIVKGKESDTKKGKSIITKLKKLVKKSPTKVAKEIEKAKPKSSSAPEVDQPQSNDFSNLPGMEDAPKDTDELFKDLRSLDFKEQIKNAEEDVKNKKDAGASESQSFESGKANQKAFNINKATASKNFKAGKKLSKPGGEDNYKEAINKIKFGESVKGKPKTKTKNRFANKVGEGIGEIIVGAAHSKVEQKYEDDLKKIGDFEVKINSSDRLGDASKVKGQDTTTNKIVQSDAMEQLNKLSQLKDEIRYRVAGVIKTGKGTISGAVASALESSGLDEEVKEAVKKALKNKLNLDAIVTHYANDYNSSQGTSYNSVMNQGGGHYQEYGQDTEVMAGKVSNFQN